MSASSLCRFAKAPSRVWRIRTLFRWYHEWKEEHVLCSPAQKPAKQILSKFFLAQARPFSWDHPPSAYYFLFVELLCTIPLGPRTARRIFTVYIYNRRPWTSPTREIQTFLRFFFRKYPRVPSFVYSYGGFHFRLDYSMLRRRRIVPKRMWPPGTEASRRAHFSLIFLCLDLQVCMTFANCRKRHLIFFCRIWKCL